MSHKTEAEWAAAAPAERDEARETVTAWIDRVSAALAVLDDLRLSDDPHRAACDKYVRYAIESLDDARKEAQFWIDEVLDPDEQVTGDQRAVLVRYVERRLTAYAGPPRTDQGWTAPQIVEWATRWASTSTDGAMRRGDYRAILRAIGNWHPGAQRAP